MIPLPFPLRPSSSTPGAAEPNYVLIPGSSYEITSADHGAVLSTHGSSESLTIAVDPEIPPGFTCTLLVEGSGAVTFFGSATIHPIGETSMSGTQGAFAVLTKGTTDWFVLTEGFAGGG